VFGKVTIRDSRFVAARPFEGDCGRYGTAILTFERRLTVYGSVIRDFDHGGIGLAGVGGAANVTVRGTRFIQRHRGGGSAIGGFFDAGRLIVRGSTFRTHPGRRPMAGIEAIQTFGAEIRHNTMDRVSSAVVIWGISVGGVIADNVAIGGPSSPSEIPSSGIVFREGESFRIERNVTKGFSNHGIRIGRHSGDHVITENDFRGNVYVDCVDNGGSNTWTGNLGHESRPPGICEVP
jgi:hypothetical protein